MRLLFRVRNNNDDRRRRGKMRLSVLVWLFIFAIPSFGGFLYFTKTDRFLLPQAGAVAKDAADEQRQRDQAVAAAQIKLYEIYKAVAKATREHEALERAQRLARGQAVAAAQDEKESARLTLLALSEEITRQLAVLDRIPHPAPRSPLIPRNIDDADDAVEPSALVFRQAGQALLNGDGPIIIERAAAQKPEALTGLITIIENSETFKDNYAAARRSLSKGEALAALSIYDALLQHRPRDRAALLGRAAALHQMARYDDAARAYETVLQNFPDELTALTNLLGLIGRQSPKIALQQLRRLYVRNPSFDAVAAQMAMIHLTIGDSNDAIRLMSQAVALNPGNPIYAVNLAIMYDRGGDAQSAVFAYERALQVADGGQDNLPLSVDSIRARLQYLISN